MKKIKPIELYYWPTPNGWKVSIMLEECKIPYVIKPVNIGKGEQFKPKFLKISPNNRMPAIIDPSGPGGKEISVFESGAILQYLGRKSGRGYYDYSIEFPQANEDRELGKKILWRVLSMLINEAADALFLNIATKEDIDLAMTKGVNYPKGLLAWADEIGIKNVLDQLEDLQNEYGEDRYRPSPLLKRMAKENKTFY